MTWTDRLDAAGVRDLDDFDARVVVEDLAWRAMRIAELEQLGRIMALHVASVARAPATVPTVMLADAIADRVLDRLGVADGDVAAHHGSNHVGRARVTCESILHDAVLVERVGRRLRRFVLGIATRAVEVVVDADAAPPIDEVTREKARRALARSGFVRVTP